MKLLAIVEYVSGFKRLHTNAYEIACNSRLRSGVKRLYASAYVFARNSRLRLCAQAPM